MSQFAHVVLGLIVCQSPKKKIAYPLLFRNIFMLVREREKVREREREREREKETERERQKEREREKEKRASGLLRFLAKEPPSTICGKQT